MAEDFDDHAEDDRWDDFEAEAKDLRHSERYPDIGTCISCLTPDTELDTDKLCPTCNKQFRENRGELLALLAKRTTNGA